MSEFLNRMLKQGGYMNQADDGSGMGGSGGAGGSAADGETAKGVAPEDKAAAPDKTADKAGSPAKTGPTDEEARLLKENMKRKEELRKAQEELANLRKQFEGIDPELVRKLLNEKADAETKELERKGDYERLKQRMAEEHGKEVKTLKERIAELEGSVGKAYSTISDLTVGTQFSQSTFIADELTLTPAKARVIYGDYFDVEDGKVVGYDKPRGAQGRTALVDQYGSPVPFDAALRKIIEADPEKDHLLKSKVKPGAGSDTKKASTEVSKGERNVDSVSKIAAGLKGLKIN